MNILKNMAVAFSMYSNIPVPHFEWTKDNMKYSMCFFPVVGAVVGGIMIGVFYLLSLAGFGSTLNGAVLAIVPILVTGGIHVDGFLDTADAISSWQPTEKRVQILKDTHTGAFAIIFGICYFILDFGFKSELSFQSCLVIACGYVLSRSLSGISVVSFKLMAKSGLAATFSDMAQKTVVRTVSIIFALVSAGLMIYISPVIGGCAIAGALIAFVYYRLMSYRNFEGINGDLAGFFLQICEILILIGAVIGDRVFV